MQNARLYSSHHQYRNDYSCVSQNFNHTNNNDKLKHRSNIKIFINILYTRLQYTHSHVCGNVRVARFDTQDTRQDNGVHCGIFNIHNNVFIKEKKKKKKEKGS